MKVSVIITRNEPFMDSLSNSTGSRYREQNVFNKKEISEGEKRMKYTVADKSNQ